MSRVMMSERNIVCGRLCLGLCILLLVVVIRLKFCRVMNVKFIVCMIFIGFFGEKGMSCVVYFVEGVC